MKNRHPNSNENTGTLSKGLAILDSFIKNKNENCSLTEIKDITGFSISTVYRLCNILESHNYLMREVKTKKYVLGSKIISLHSMFKLKNQLITLANPYIRDLCNEIQETVSISDLINCKIVLISIMEPDRVFIPSIYIGSEWPITCSSSGKLFLSSMSDESIKKTLELSGMPSMTEHSITTVDKFMEQIIFTRNSGYSICDREYDKDFLAISAPIKNINNEIIASVSIDTLSARHDDKSRKILIEKLLKTSREISNEINSI